VELLLGGQEFHIEVRIPHEAQELKLVYRRQTGLGEIDLPAEVMKKIDGLVSLRSQR